MDSNPCYGETSKGDSFYPALQCSKMYFLYACGTRVRVQGLLVVICLCLFAAAATVNPLASVGACCGTLVVYLLLEHLPMVRACVGCCVAHS